MAGRAAVLFSDMLRDHVLFVDVSVLGSFDFTQALALYENRSGRIGWVYGGRLSLLGGDWGSDGNDFITERHRDDNVVVHELYAGIEAARCFRSCNVHARLAFEMQNWDSDVLSEAADIGTIGFVGPGIQIGAEF